ncbi:hypothetical protein EUA04_22045 [Mycolicibacterium obuense]|uniref:Uncharacterized protein n=1 Tax=Mycolicibacterium obuense TaxID=1807 RepID=A0A4R5X1K9_9MYCO|nr:hypothetical protein [Mycolicibacterium obuense]TDL04463.1 hypothetical protein EUA04_22045 [Mycolicibacterium obuense]
MAANDHSVAIGQVGSLGTLNVEARTVHMNFHVPAPSSSSAEAVGPSPLDTADAVSLGPLASTEAQGLLDRANQLAADDPRAALELFREVQRRLVAAGFPIHAAEFDHRVAALCVSTGEEDTAVRLMLQSLWEADISGSSMRADRVLGALRNLAGFPDFPKGSEEPLTARLGAAVEIAEFVSDHLQTPVPLPIEIPSEAISLVDAEDRARTVLFAAESALGDDNLAWIVNNRQVITTAADEIAHTLPEIALRLRLASADATGEWGDLLHAASSGIARNLKALVLARHARHKLLQAVPIEADRDWRAAVNEACLSERYTDAADWLLSQRFVANRFGVLADDKWHPLAQALLNMPSKARIVAGAESVRELGLAALHFNSPRIAAINLRRHLLEGIRSASFFDERDARGLLGAHYLACGELPLAAFYTIGAGNYKESRDVAKAFGDTYHDVTELIKSPLSWVCASALEFTTQQADLIPDNDLNSVVAQALSTIDDVASGARLDSPVFSPQMRRSAYGLLAAVSERLTACDAETVLKLLSGFVECEKHHYRPTDESHVLIAAGIAQTHTGELRGAAVKQLIGLYGRASHAFGDSARRALAANFDQVRDRLHEMAEGTHLDAAAFLAWQDPADTTTDAAQAAAQRLCQPAKSGPNGFGVGTGAVNDSLLAASLSEPERISCIEMLFKKAESSWEPATNRDDYLRAASNLVNGIPGDTRRTYFTKALSFASDMPHSKADAFQASMSSPLSAMRVNDGSDCRPAAVYLAGRLADTVEEKQRVRDAALRLVGVGTDEDYRVTKTLQLVQSQLDGSVGLLAQGSWTLKSLAAMLWVESTTLPDEVGIALSRDPDVRVRKALARALSSSPNRADSIARITLAQDPRWSVRTLSNNRSTDR